MPAARPTVTAGSSVFRLSVTVVFLLPPHVALHHGSGLTGRRNAVERINSRIDNSFGFERHYIRGKAKMTARVGACGGGDDGACRRSHEGRAAGED